MELLDIKQSFLLYLPSDSNFEFLLFVFWKKIHIQQKNWSILEHTHHILSLAPYWVRSSEKYIITLGLQKICKLALSPWLLWVSVKKMALWRRWNLHCWFNSFWRAIHHIISDPSFCDDLLGITLALRARRTWIWRKIFSIMIPIYASRIPRAFRLGSLGTCYSWREGSWEMKPGNISEDRPPAPTPACFQMFRRWAYFNDFI